MSRILVFGRAPLPWQRPDRAFGHGRRTWQLARALAGAGHRVLLLAAQTADEDVGDVERDERDGVTVWTVAEHACHERPELIARHLEAHRPDGVVAVTGEAAAIVVNHVGELPLWSDLASDPLVDAQARASTGGDWRINDAYRKHVPVLMRSDHLSARSRAHRAALVGQIGMIGRLIGENDGYEFVSVTPEVLDDAEIAELRGIERRLRAPSDRFYLLWSGAFRAWADVDTLFEAVEMLMTENERFEFCAVGGADAAAAQALARLGHRASQSPFQARIDLPGWVSRAGLLERYARADAAVFVERPCYQSVFGRRGRVPEWLGAGLPVVCTDLTETAAELAAAGAAHVVPAGGVIELRDAIRRLVDDPEEALGMGLRGRRYAREALSVERGLAPLLAWAAAPRRAPANEARVTLERHPSALRMRADTVRGHLEERGAAGTALAVGRFAARRIKRRALRAVDRLAEPEERR